MDPGSVLWTPWSWGFDYDELAKKGISNQSLMGPNGEANTAYIILDSAGTTQKPAAGAAKTRVFNAAGTELTASAHGNRYVFQGREIDWATGLYHFRARWYNPETGRWLSKDPIGISGALNQYAAFGNNPVNFRDPFGNKAQTGVKAGGISNLSNSPVNVYSPESGTETVGPWSSSSEGTDWDSVESPAGSGNWEKIGPGQNAIGPDGSIDSNPMRWLDKRRNPDKYKPGNFPIPPDDKKKE